MNLALSVVFASAIGGACGLSSAAAQAVTIPAGVPLRIQVDHRYRVRAGTPVEGRLIAPIYSIDHKVLPVGTRVSGTILGKHRPSEDSRTKDIIDGEFVPPGVPDVTFSSLRLPDGAVVPIQTSVVQRDATIVKMSVNRKRSSLTRQVREQIESRRREALDTLHHPNLGDRLRKWVYAQLPWSPATIWTGTQFDAELTAPVSLPGPAPAPLPEAQIHGTPTGLVEARLTTGIDSARDKHGDPVTAILTAPLLTPDGREVILPEGAQMHGMVTVAQPARWFARTGRLRFTFRNVEVPGQQETEVHGQLAASEASSQTQMKISEEGTAQSSPGPGKYLAPMALGVLATSTYGDDAGHPVNGAVVSNGFGFAARIATAIAANPLVGRGFAYFALSKSLYYRWIARGKEIDFPRDTRLEILLNQR